MFYWQLEQTGLNWWYERVMSYERVWQDQRRNEKAEDHASDPLGADGDPSAEGDSSGADRRGDCVVDGKIIGR